MKQQQRLSSIRGKKTHFLTDQEVLRIRRELRHAKTARSVAYRWGLSESYVGQLGDYTRRAHCAV
jgi:hypothetical protein